MRKTKYVVQMFLDGARETCMIIMCLSCWIVESFGTRRHKDLVRLLITSYINILKDVYKLSTIKYPVSYTHLTLPTKRIV